MVPRFVFLGISHDLRVRQYSIVCQDQNYFSKVAETDCVHTVQRLQHSIAKVVTKAFPRLGNAPADSNPYEQPNRRLGSAAMRAFNSSDSSSSRPISHSILCHFAS